MEEKGGHASINDGRDFSGFALRFGGIPYFMSCSLAGVAMNWPVIKIIAASALLVLIGSFLRPGVLEVGIVVLLTLGVVAIARGRRSDGVARQS